MKDFSCEIDREHRLVMFRVTKTKITAVPLNRHDDLVHAFTTRHVSADDLKRTLLKPAGLRPIFLRQVHSDAVRAVDDVPAAACSGDALITRQPGLALVIKTADCVPVLLFDPVSRSIAAVHAGWRGTLRRIAQKTAGALRAHYGADPARMVAVLGPAIGPCCYEVGEEVIEHYRSQFPWAGQVLVRHQPENPADILLPRQLMLERKAFMRTLATTKAHLDLPGANRRQLLEAGLNAKNIIAGAPCTACRTDLLYSYRREGPRAGRLYAVIGLRPEKRRSRRRAPTARV